MKDCPVCGAPDMVFWPGAFYENDGCQEPDAWECPDCGNLEVMDR